VRRGTPTRTEAWLVGEGLKKALAGHQHFPTTTQSCRRAAGGTMKNILKWLVVMAVTFTACVAHAGKKDEKKAQQQQKAVSALPAVGTQAGETAEARLAKLEKIAAELMAQNAALKATVAANEKQEAERKAIAKAVTPEDIDRMADDLIKQRREAREKKASEPQFKLLGFQPGPTNRSSRTTAVMSNFDNDGTDGRFKPSPEMRLGNAGYSVNSATRIFKVAYGKCARVKLDSQHVITVLPGIAGTAISPASAVDDGIMGAMLHGGGVLSIPVASDAPEARAHYRQQLNKKYLVTEWTGVESGKRTRSMGLADDGTLSDMICSGEEGLVDLLGDPRYHQWTAECFNSQPNNRDQPMSRTTCSSGDTAWRNITLCEIETPCQ